MGIKAGKKFFEEAYKLGNKRIKVGFGWPIKGVGSEIKDFFKAIKEKIHTGKVLDLGCGEGRICIFFAKNGFESYGIDFAKSAIIRAKKFAKEEDVEDNIKFKVGNVLELSYPNNFFDVVVDWSVFDHIEPKNWDLYLKNLTKVLKLNGFFILTVFSINTPSISKNKNWYYSGDAYFHFFTKGDIKNIFGDHFNIIKSKERLKTRPPPTFMFYHILLRRKS